MSAANTQGVSLQEALETDLDWILGLEEAAEKGGFVSGDNAMRHRMQMNDPTSLYLIAKRGDEPVGYVILRGLSGAQPVVELKRIVIGKTDAGHGQSVMALVLLKVFGEYNAHRLWLDVIDDNVRAQHVYRKLGFVEEGRMRLAAKRHGEWRDLIIFGLLADEFRKAS
jgi:diamine N-acetyltransferase